MAESAGEYWHTCESPRSSLAIDIIVVTNQPTPYRDALFDAVSRILRPVGSLQVIYKVPMESDRNWDASSRSHRYLVASRRLGPPGVDLSVGRALRVASLCHTEIAAATNPVVVAAGYENPFLFASLASIARRHRAPLLLWAGTHAYSSREKSKGAATVRRIVARSVDGALAYSSRAATELEALGVSRAVPIGNAHRLLGGSSGSTASRIPVPRDPMRLLYVGRLVPEKNVAPLAQAVADLRASSYPELTLTVAGTGPELSTVRAAGGAAIRFAGNCDARQLSDLYSRAGLLVLPTTFDPWGLVVNEAMEAGCPVLVDKRAGCVPDLAEDGVTARVSSLGSREQIAFSLMRAISETSGQSSSVTLAARQRVKAFRPGRVAARFVGAVESLNRFVEN